MLSADDVDAAAQRLASEGRSLLGLPEGGPSCHASSSRASWARHISHPPTALEFSRIVARHVPVLIDHCMTGRPCVERWKKASYLIEAMGPSRRVQVAVTPNGRADDVHMVKGASECGGDDLDGTRDDVFVLPHEEWMTFDNMLKRLQATARDLHSTDIAYLQSQNSNLTNSGDADGGSGDLLPLLQDICATQGENNGAADRFSSGTALPWADEALGKRPEATNLWIGTSASRTSMHRDHYENLFTVLRGTKIFTLYPPFEAHFLCDDRPYDVWQWAPPREPTREWTLSPAQGTPPTPWIPIDPTQPASSPRNRRFPRYAKALPPLVIEVHEGETLYLPAGWYHHVAQRGDDAEGLCICVNWWYESEHAFGDRWALESFVKEVGQRARGE